MPLMTLARRACENDPLAPDNRAALKDSQNTAAMLTTYNEVDMTEVMALRNEYKDLFLKKHGVKLGFHVFLHQGLRACAERSSRGQRRN